MIIRSNRKYYEETNIELTALAVAAREAGMSYGSLIAQTTSEEQKKIIQTYRERMESKVKDSQKR